MASHRWLTFYGLHPKRGTAAMNGFGIVPRRRRWVVHDLGLRRGLMHLTVHGKRTVGFTDE